MAATLDHPDTARKRLPRLRLNELLPASDGAASGRTEA